LFHQSSLYLREKRKIIILPFTFFENISKTTALFWKFFFFATFPIVGYSFVFLSHVTLYAISHTKFQVYLLLDCINYLTAEYEDENDVKLLESEEYQKIVKERLRSLVIRHNELKR
jgi:hypothetical protein